MRNPSNPASPRAFRPDRPSGAHPTTSQTAPATGALAADIASFRRHLAARNLSPKTERTYIDAAHVFETLWRGHSTAREPRRTAGQGQGDVGLQALDSPR